MAFHVLWHDHVEEYLSREDRGLTDEDIDDLFARLDEAVGNVPDHVRYAPGRNDDSFPMDFVFQRHGTWYHLTLLVNDVEANSGIVEVIWAEFDGEE